MRIDDNEDTARLARKKRRMKQIAGAIQFSASDLIGHLSCQHSTKLDLAVARGMLEKPRFNDPMLEVLQQMGMKHEEGYIDHLKTRGVDVHEVCGVGVTSQMVAETLELMNAGVAAIKQGALSHGSWVGRADILKRVEFPSRLGSWSYEVFDTKLSADTKASTVLQLCFYSALLAEMQGAVPEKMHVVVPWCDYMPQVYRVADFAAYYRWVRAALAQSVEGDVAENTYPDPKPYCDVCGWRVPCEERRRLDDHLSLVAGISKAQIVELNENGVSTTAVLAAMPMPLQWKPDRGSAHSFERIREQARIQVESRHVGAPLFELLAVEPGFGLSYLPIPSPGDIFFDLEGDPFVGRGGLEFLFGICTLSASGDREYRGSWATSAEEEKRVFEEFVDFVMDRWEHFPDLHIFHYAPYEPSALKRLMGRYGTREDEVDRMLRGKLFVDLYSVARQAIRAGVESYSIKKLEAIYGFERNTELPDARLALSRIQAALELNDTEAISDESKQVVESYNCDDCISTERLRDWLEKLRAEQVAQGVAIERPQVEEAAPSEGLNEWQQKVAQIYARLTADIPGDETRRTTEQQSRWILANVLDWHRREEKATWWEYFRLKELSNEELVDERTALANLDFVAAVGGTTRAPVHRYRFPPQDTELRAGDELKQLGGAPYGKVEGISFDERTVDIKKQGKTAETHSSAVFVHKLVSSKELAASLMRIGEWVADCGWAVGGRYEAAGQLLLKEKPTAQAGSLRNPHESSVTAACRIGLDMGSGVLPIQGPPGAGKTFTGARMICELVRKGKRIGVTANSHKVIRNLLNAVIEAAWECGTNVRCIQKAGEKADDLPSLRFAKNNEDVFAALGADCQVAGGTAWLWAREDALESVDVLFVDEAAQMSLANVLAISQAAKRLVLLGDPQQLDQPMQGSHPEGTDVSALEYVLDGHQTIPSDRGLFLEETWRMHPEISRYTSEMFYEGRLRSVDGTVIQEVRSTGVIRGSGLRYLPVPHTGNHNCSPEEAEQIVALVNDILESCSTWIDRNGEERKVQLEDILVIAPYNAQVFEIQERLPGARVGTVDKFQGQEAPISIYSMATSTHADAPRGMEFLYSANRLNVATSRAKCISVIIGSPELFKAECRTPRQMQLANAFCRYRELAETIDVGVAFAKRC